MIAPSDETYQQTKLVKAGNRTLLPPFKELAAWIAEHYRGVSILNVYYDTIIPDNRPRLSIIFEREHDRRRFTGAHGNYDPTEQAKVAARFREILAEQRNNDFDTDGLFVIFCAFEPVARVEANWSVTKEQVTQLKAILNNPTIWEIRSSWEEVVFFFYTDAQLKASEESGVRNLCVDAYSKILSQYDEFGYFRERPITASFDSKENFDATYGGNWFNYDRR